jgi:glycosyltransferase involved in cell wall biosynthesis
MSRFQIPSGVSVVICCYNSESLLPTTIQYIAKQIVPNDIPWEVIIVDNASTDKTIEVAQREVRLNLKNIPYTIVEQPVKGLTAAREKGLECARYEVVIFCDDDNWLTDRYIDISFKIMINNATIGALGGKGEVMTDGKIPSWFATNEALYAVGSQNNFSGDITETRGWVSGAGFVIRKSAWLLMKKNGYNHLLRGRQGRGQDVEMCLAIRLAGYKIWYDDRLTFKHFIPKNRLDWKYFLNLNETQHRAIPIFSAYNHVLNLNNALYRPPSKWHWLHQSFKLFKILSSYYKVILLSLYRDIEKEQEGSWRIRYYRQLRGQLFSWLRLRSKYVGICDKLYLLKIEFQK